MRYNTAEQTPKIMNSYRAFISSAKMSRHKITIAIFILCIGLIFTTSNLAIMQSPPSREILFRSFDMNRQIREPIGKLNINTGEMAQVDTTSVGLWEPIGWSPSGKWLVAAQYIKGAPNQSYEYCILDRVFRLQSCIEELIGADALAYFGRITWSSDESKIYFIQAPGDETWRFVEASIFSGKTLGILANSTQVASFGKPFLSWSSDLKVLANSSQLISLEDTSQTILPVMKTLRFAGVQEISPNSIGNMKNNIEGSFELCGYSPQGKYLTAYDLRPEAHFFLIFDDQGRLLKYLDKTNGPIPIVCPNWGLNDAYFVFWDTMYERLTNAFSRTNIIRYDLNTFTQTIVYNGPTLSVIGTMSPSPDGKWIAFRTSDIYFPNQIGVVGANNSVRYFGKSDHEYGSLVWVPPLIESQ